MNRNSSISNAIIVLGMHRSGTSALTKALSALGVSLGTNLLPSDKHNPKGFFEDQDIISLNNQMLAEMGCAWDTIAIPSTEPAAIARFKDSAMHLIKLNYANLNFWALKDPRITRLQKHWHQLLSDINIGTSYIMITRHPLSVVRSLQKRDNLAEFHALCLWLAHQKEALTAVDSNNGIIFDYDLLLTSAMTNLERLRDFLNISDASLDQNKISEYTNAFLATELRHSHFDGPDSLASTELGFLCWKLHSHLLERAESRNPPNADRGTPSHLIDEINAFFKNSKNWITAIDSMTAKLHKLQEKAQMLKDETMTLRSQVAYFEKHPIVRLKRTIKNIAR